MICDWCAPPPDLPADQIWPLATTRAAKALGLQSQLGSLTPGKAGDVIAFEVDSENPLEQILASRCAAERSR